ncbi:MAG: septal ring lytic transglycosylase RlpA family protein [Rhodoferax sp.]
MAGYTVTALALLTLALAGCSGAPTRPGTAQNMSLRTSAATADSTPALQPAQTPAAVLAVANPEESDAAAATDAPDVLPAQAAKAPTAQRGLASWYGRAFNGQRTASGKRFNMHALTAAHPKLPLGSYARVTLLSTGKSVVVHITDRGPYKAHRIIDVSRAAAAKLGLLRRGVGEVAVQPVAPPEQQFASAQ